MKQFLKNLKQILIIIPKSSSKKLPLIMVLLLVQSIFEILGLSALIPVILSIFNESFHIENTFGKVLFEFFGFSHRNELIIFLSISLLLFIIIKNIVSIKIMKYCSKFSISLYKDIALKLHKIYFEKGFLFFKNTNSSVIWRNIDQATFLFSGQQVMSSIVIINEILISLIIFFFISYYNFNISLLLIFLIFPPFYIFYIWVQKRAYRLGKEREIQHPKLTKRYYESIHGYNDIMISGTQNFFRYKIKNTLNEVVKNLVEFNLNVFLPTKILETALMSSICIIIYYGIIILNNPSQTLITISFFAIAGYRLTPSINRIVNALNAMKGTEWVLSIIFEELSFTINKKEDNHNITFNKNLRLKNINYFYPDSKIKILKDFSLTIIKGECVGIRGESGSGKSTLLNIMLGFLTPSSGSYLIDGVELVSNNIVNFRKKIGYVSQNFFILDGSIKENIAFGIDEKNIDAEALNKAIEQAKLSDVVKDLPNGLDENIGENGLKLSGGQRQRVSIARALYQQAEILIFDEATSSLDHNTEIDITDSIKLLTDSDLTIIIVAHRETSLIHCDRIIDITN